MRSVHYINTGAYVAGERPKTKKALREAVVAAPGTVTFDGTAAFGLGADVTYELPRLHELPAYNRLAVCGPDPYTSRKWYATVSWDKDGKVKVT